MEQSPIQSFKCDVIRKRKLKLNLPKILLRLGNLGIGMGLLKKTFNDGRMEISGENVNRFVSPESSLNYIFFAPAVQTQSDIRCTLEHLLGFLNKHMDCLHTFLIIYQTSGGTMSHLIVTIPHLGSFLAGFVSLSNCHTKVEPLDIFIGDRHCSMAEVRHISSFGMEDMNRVYSGKPCHGHSSWLFS